MTNQPLQRVGSYIKKEVDGVQSAMRDVVSDAKESWRRDSARTIGEKLNAPPMISPMKLKRAIITIIKILIVLELVGAFLEGMESGSWFRLGTDLIIAGILYIAWEGITRLTRERKDEYRRRMENISGRIRLVDAFMFSLLWSDEIYAGIPDDRKRLIVIAYTLIAFSVLAAFLQIGGGLMLLVISGSLVLGAVNLVSWVVSRERIDRETLQTELALAQEVQSSLMPRECPPVPGFDIAGFSLPAMEVGGDHYDYIRPEHDSSTLGIAIFDVSGKGMQAAMSAVFSSGAFVSEVRNSSSPAHILTRLNCSLHNYVQKGHFVSCLYGVLDPSRGTFLFSNAGQMKPLLWRNGVADWIDSVGPPFPLGVITSVLYEDREISLGRGDVMLLLTDGFVEAMDPDREVYGMDRFRELVGSLPLGELTANATVTTLIDAMRSHMGTAPQHDDMTMVVVKAL